MNQASVFEWHKRFNESRVSVRDDDRCGGVRKSIQQSWLAKGLRLGSRLRCWRSKEVNTSELIGQRVKVRVEVLREFKKKFRRKRQALFKSGLWHFHQDNAPGNNSILHKLFDKDGHQHIYQPPYSRDLAPCDISLFPWLRGCRYETIEEMKEAVKRALTRSQKRTSMGPSWSALNGTTRALQPEGITSKGTRVSCVCYQ